MYLRHGIPWFKLYDDYIEGIATTSETLAGVMSVPEIDKRRLEAAGPSVAQVPDRVINPDAPPPCFQHPLATSAFVFRPCGHAACALTNALENTYLTQFSC